MENKDRIIKRIAGEVGLSADQVKAIVISPISLFKRESTTGGTRSVYIRKVGTFMHKETKAQRKVSKMEARAEKKIKQQLLIEDEDPLTF